MRSAGWAVAELTSTLDTPHPHRVARGWGRIGLTGVNLGTTGVVARVLGKRRVAPRDEQGEVPAWSAAACGPGSDAIDGRKLRIAQDAAADELLGRDPLALLIGMLLDQHMRQRSSDRRPYGWSCTA
jgi:hypothetical protein